MTRTALIGERADRCEEDELIRVLVRGVVYAVLPAIVPIGTPSQSFGIVQEVVVIAFIRKLDQLMPYPDRLAVELLIEHKGHEQTEVGLAASAPSDGVYEHDVIEIR